jgi:hypothetical protein
MEFVSASKLKTFRTCPYSLKDKFKSSPATLFGDAVHTGLAAHLTGKEFLPAYRAKASILGVSMEKEPDAIKSFDFAQSLEIPVDNIITVESADGDKTYFDKKFFEIPFSDSWGVRGAMDLVFVADDGGLVILDWKTGQTKEEDDLQLAVYALAAWKKYGSFPYIKTIFAYVQQGFTQSTFWNAETLVGALEYVRPLAEEYLSAIKSGNLPQKPHKWCKFCGLTETCEAYKRQLEAKPDRASYDIEPTIKNLPAILEYHDKVKAIADTAYSIQQMMKEKYEAVLMGAGKVNIGGRTVELKEKVSRYNYNLSAIFPAVQSIINRPPLEICEYSSSGMKEIEKELNKDQKKYLKEIIEGNREVKSKAKTLSISIAKEAMAENAEESSAEAEASA